MVATKPSNSPKLTSRCLDSDSGDKIREVLGSEILPENFPGLHVSYNDTYYVLQSAVDLRVVFNDSLAMIK